MIITIRNTDYSEECSLIDRYPALAKFGYHDEKICELGWGSGYVGKIIINSPEELFLLRKELDQEIVILGIYNDNPEIEIYDDWRE